jgi:hypothetical protein
MRPSGRPSAAVRKMEATSPMLELIMYLSGGSVYADNINNKNSRLWSRVHVCVHMWGNSRVPSGSQWRYVSVEGRQERCVLSSRR